MSNISIVLCTYNEEHFISETIDKLNKLLYNCEIIIVDDNSKDRTIKIIKEKQKKIKNIKLIQRKRGKGLASAITTGLTHASKKYIGWIDTNMSYVINHFPYMKKKLLSGADLILLSRYVQNGKDERFFLRAIASRILNFFCRIYLTNQIKDFSSGMFLMRRDILNELVPLGYGHGDFFIEYIYKLYKLKFIIKEIPYTQKADQIPNNSKTAPNITQFLKLSYIYFFRIILCKIRNK